ncbi:restriction endonuclease subunit S [Vibrio aestuarianus]|jgi:type I restriction enzyme, S subunit|uniref:Type I restriction-modification system, specificity subunit S n=1 Tax=Vibrio aestuarianus TaxID=28171 RepID=A0ABM9FL02_9VIBR|nr:restriction endonuclease subunit S [Vibrio aestuarianus]MDE1213215.1 restriction endonuclease subunit S [Vibrio aestuarianus]MDE1216585.1 restriction endonuclease subunit S [Vibrio aestuarianus]MDE1255250.1 restriction endonuclease subunit S [Vibrio aestuarianus]MDE1267066.1 restriction endonuclease subunit S [Vibrio aestuarianus]MDE1274578.1 restriction endonuclease subunit S [Vibrio aestuarianus]
MTGRYKAYPEYKESGVDWLHDIPEHWKTMPVGQCYHRVKRTGYEAEELLSVYRDYGVVPKSSRDDNNNKPSDDLSPYQLVCENNLVMNKMKAWQGSIAISEYRGIVSPAYFVYEPFSHTESIVYPKYVHYLLRHPIYITQYMSRSKGIRVNQWDLDPESFQSIELLLPLKEEQQKIINFLDHETAKIDTLITKQEKLIELLKEKRQAVISHAVTKGLNPDAPMKDSGVEWLGEVPEHWGVASIRRFLLEHRQGYYTTEPYIDDGVKLLRITDLRDLGEVSTDNCPKVPEHSSLSNYYLKEGDVVFARTGGAGSFGVIPKIRETVAYASYLIRFRFTPEHFNTDYQRFMLIADSFQLAVKSNIHGGVNQNIHAEDIKDTFVCCPPIKEQQNISEFLNDVCVKYNLLIDKAIKQIELMKERKTALISAAVTGKIDIRDWQGEA